MLKQLKVATFLTFFALILATYGQFCIRNEVLAALEELEIRNPQNIALQSNQSANICEQVEKLNNTMQQNFQEHQQILKEELYAVQDNINEKLEGIEEVQRGIEEKVQGIQHLLLTILSLHYNPGFSPSHPAHSCKEIYDRNTSSPSGYYWLENSSEQTVQAYCDMERTCGGVQGGWMKVISINVSNTTDSCPSGLKTLTSPKRLCAMNTDVAGCSSAYLNVHGVEYSRVCGKIIGYEQNTPNAFNPYYGNQAITIDDVYVDGISLTHGQNPRKHIWTFAVALHEVTTSYPQSLCPCTNIHNQLTIPIPPYVGNDYFCDTAAVQYAYTFFPDDPLWDGQGCGRLNTCCSFNSPPWFMKQLPASTHDNIEIRLCSDQEQQNEDITFETLELYVQ